MLTDVNYMIPVYLVNIFWLLYNLLGALTALLACFEKQRVRAAERFMIDDNPALTLENGRRISTRLEDISLDSCALALENPLEDADRFVDSPVTVSVDQNQLLLEGTFYRSRSWGKKIIILFDGLTQIQHSHLVNFIIDHQESGYGRFNIKRENFIHTYQEIIKKWFKRLKNTH